MLFLCYGLLSANHMGKLVEICMFAAFGAFMPSSVRMLGDSRSSSLVHVHCDGTSHLQRRICFI
jgi:hypothetical protein